MTDSKFKVSENHYITKWNSPFVLTYSWLLYVAAAVGGFSVSLYALLHNFQKETVAKSLALMLFSWGMYYVIGLMYQFFTTAFQVILEEDGVRGISLYGFKRYIPYEKIREIRPAKNLLQYANVDIVSDEVTININPRPLLLFGEMMEKLLVKAVNCEVVELSKFTKPGKGWQKKPDEAVLNLAIKRAEENRHGK